MLLPDAGPLITLACADALDLLFKPGWTLQLVDMVLHEVARHATPTSERIGDWARDRGVRVLPTRTFERHARTAARISNLGELAIQEVMNEYALSLPPTRGVFLFEDHKIARAGFLLPESCQKVSTRAFLLFLEAQGLVESAAEVQAVALRAGRAFSQLRFPPA
ncbi:MAG: hypothetical protein V4750_18370 [Pseudomonadota bacterium]